MDRSPNDKLGRLSRTTTMASLSDAINGNENLDTFTEQVQSSEVSTSLDMVLACIEPTEALGFCSMADLAKLRGTASKFGGRQPSHSNALLDASVMTQLVSVFLERRGVAGSSLHAAAEEGDLEAAWAHLHHLGSPVDACDGYGAAPLHYAAEARSSSILRMLLRAGADPNVYHRGRNMRAGWTALHFAANAGARDCVFLLLYRPSPWGGMADVNAMDICRRTPLFYALDKERHSCITLLRKFGGRADLHFIAAENLQEVQRIDDGNTLGRDRHDIDAWGGHGVGEQPNEAAAVAPYLHPYLGPAGDTGPSLTFAAAMMPGFEW